MVAELNVNTDLRVFVRKCRGKQELPPSFLLSNKERTKAQKNSLKRLLSVREVGYRKGRC